MEPAMLTEHPYPTLYIPRWCFTLEHEFESSDNLFFNVNIVANDIDGRQVTIYSGFLDLKVIDSNEIPPDPVLLQNQLMPDKSDSYYLNSYDNRTWINLDETQYQETQFSYIPGEQLEEITYQSSPQNSQNAESVFLHKKFRRSSSRDREETEKYNENSDSPNLDTDTLILSEFKNGSDQIQVVGEYYEKKKSPLKKNVPLKESIAIVENCALKQLMSDFNSPKEMKIIVFGEDNDDEQAIFQIENTDSITKTSMLNTKKFYQCQDCKDVFIDIKSFREHTTIHTNAQPTASTVVPKTEDFQVATTKVNFCSTCNRTFKSINKYKQHVLGHCNPDVECPKCFKVLASRYTLRMHMMLHNRKYSCPKCTMTYDCEETLQRHLRGYHDRQTCSICGQFFKSETLLDAHKSKWHGIVACKICNAQLYSHNEYINHLNDHIQQKFSSDEENSVEFKTVASTLTSSFDAYEAADSQTPDPIIRQIINENLFGRQPKSNKKGIARVCIVCKKKFDRTNDMKRHLIEHVLKRSLMNTPVSNDGSLRLLCDVCGEASFSKTEAYKAHLREHANLTIYKCLLCDKSFSDSSNFSKHKKLHGDSRYECDMCNRKFNSKKTISLHMELHTKTAPLTCFKCNKKFHFASMLNRHIKSKHIKTKYQVSCRICQCIFNSVKEKWDHEWNLHKIRNHILDCLACDKKFRKYVDLKRHCYDVHHIVLPRFRSYTNM